MGCVADQSGLYPVETTEFVIMMDRWYDEGGGHLPMHGLLCASLRKDVLLNKEERTSLPPPTHVVKFKGLGRSGPRGNFFPPLRVTWVFGDVDRVLVRVGKNTLEQVLTLKEAKPDMTDDDDNRPTDDISGYLKKVKRQ